MSLSNDFHSTHLVYLLFQKLKTFPVCFKITFLLRKHLFNTQGKTPPFKTWPFLGVLIFLTLYKLTTGLREIIEEEHFGIDANTNRQ